MILLPNNCRCTGKPGNLQKGIQPSLPIHPKNWNTLKASLKEDWYVSYRFYDPRFHGFKQRIIKGMNEFKTLEERQTVTRAIMRDELFMLMKKSFNPFTGECIEPEPKKPVNPKEITADTPLIEALEKAKDEIKVSITVKRDLKSVLKYFSKAAELLEKNEIPIGQIKSRDIRLILNSCQHVKEAEKKRWSENQFNHYRSHISMLFTLISDDDIIDFNPVSKIKKADYAPEIRTMLTDEQRALVDEHLKLRAPVFRRYVNIFFHSGARSAELMRVQGKHVDLPKQRYQVLVKKRKKMVWVWKMIKDIALPFWEEAMTSCRANDYVFGRGLVSGNLQQDPHHISELWFKYVKQPKDKGGLGIDVDIYSLKHLHTTEVRDILEENTQMQDEEALKEIAEHNSHTSTAMVVKIYDTKNDDRKGKKVKTIRNAFA